MILSIDLRQLYIYFEKMASMRVFSPMDLLDYSTIISTSTPSLRPYPSFSLLYFLLHPEDLMFYTGLIDDDPLKSFLSWFR